MAKLRELVYNTENTIEHKTMRESLDIMDTKKRNFDKERMYDINQILEKAKYENNKLKEPVTTKTTRNILSTLQLEPLAQEQINNEEIITESETPTYQESDNMYMTREFKFKELNNKISELNSNPLIDNVMPDNELSLELFEDLKPVGNTIITKPITDSSDYKGDMHSNDTRDIDIIKPAIDKKEEDFFTNSYEFSKKDFSLEEQDNFFEEKNTGTNILKIILLLIAILAFSFVIVYFVLTYGIGV